MDFVKKCKKVLGSTKRLNPEDSGSGSYGKLPHGAEEKQKQKKKKKTKGHVAPHGCLCVYVGEEREKFVIKIKHANHPLFKAFLDAAESEYGYRNDGPLWLPCHVDLFSEALAEMEDSLQRHDDDVASVGCGFHHSNRSSSSVVHGSPYSYHSNPAADYQLLV